MKRFLLTVLVLSLLALPLMGAVSAGNLTHDPSSVPAVPAGLQELSAADFIPGSVPAESGVTDAIQLPVCALVLSMAETGLSYDPENSIFIWNALYYALSLYGRADERSVIVGDTLLLPSESAQDFLHALFRSCPVLPEIPHELSDRVSYDPLTDQFALGLGDFGVAEISFGPLLPAGNGVFCVEGTLTSPERDVPLCSFRVTLAENESMFGFSVLEAAVK